MDVLLASFSKFCKHVYNKCTSFPIRHTRRHTCVIYAMMLAHSSNEEFGVFSFDIDMLVDMLATTFRADSCTSEVAGLDPRLHGKGADATGRSGAMVHASSSSELFDWDAQGGEGSSSSSSSSSWIREPTEKVDSEKACERAGCEKAEGEEPDSEKEAVENAEREKKEMMEACEKTGSDKMTPERLTATGSGGT